MKIKSLITIVTVYALLLSIGCASPNNSTINYNTDANKITLKPALSSVPTLSSLSFSPDGKLIAKGDKSAILFIDASDNKIIKRVETGGGYTVTSLSYSPNGKYISAGSYRSIYIWDITSYQIIKTIPAHKDYITHLAFSADGNTLASGSKGMDKEIKVWDTAVWEEKNSFPLEENSLYADMTVSLALSPDSRLVAFTGLQGKGSIYNISSGAKMKTIETGSALLSISFTPGGNIVTGDANGSIKMWDIKSGELIKTIEGNQAPVTFIAFNNKGTYMVSGGKSGAIRIWDINGWRYLKKVELLKETTILTADAPLSTAASLDKDGGHLFYKLLDLNSPPTVHISSPSGNITVDGEKIRVTGNATDDKGISDISFMVNNIKISTEGRDLSLAPTDIKQRGFDIDIPLQIGVNTITVSAVDIDGTSSSENVIVNRNDTGREVWAAVIGISAYKNIQPLKYADSDALEMYKYLTEYNGIPKDHIFRLINEEATNRNVRDVLGVKLRKLASREDTILIYFAGHGATEPDVTSPDGDGLEKYLLTHDTETESLYSTALPMGDISKILSWIQAERVVFMFDTCYSGAAGGKPARTVMTAMRTRAINSNFLKRISEGKGRVILTASDTNEISIEDDKLGHGVFTYYLLEGLKGEADKDMDGRITVDEAYNYVSQKVPDATGQNQHPVKRGDVIGDIFLGKTKQ